MLTTDSDCDGMTTSSAAELSSSSAGEWWSQSAAANTEHRTHGDSVHQ